MSEEDEPNTMNVDPNSIPSRTDFDAKIAELLGTLKRTDSIFYFDKETYSKFMTWFFYIQLYTCN